MTVRYKHIVLNCLNHAKWFKYLLCLLFIFKPIISSANILIIDTCKDTIVSINKNNPSTSPDSVSDIFILIEKYKIPRDTIENIIIENGNIVIDIEESNSDWIWKPLFALKTNLLFDAVTALNVEVEVPIKQHWSIAGEWIFPWWLRYKNDESIRPSRLEILCGALEGRYWFGKREDKRVLTGWFTGLYSGAGLYDLQWKSKGYQGEFFVAAGVSVGYAHRINKKRPNLSLEYSIGVGFFRSHYRHYEAFWGDDNKWHPLRLNNGRYTWVGPTRAKISLVWLLNYKSKKGGKL